MDKDSTQNETQAELLALRQRVAELEETSQSLSKAKEALRESEARFRTLMSRMPACVFQTDTAGICTFVNEHWRELTGQAPPDAVNIGWRNAIHPEDRQRVVEEWFNLTKQAKSIELDYRITSAEGELRWAEVRAEPIFDEQGRHTGHIGTVTDISERKRIEVLLRESLEQKEIIESQRAKLAELSTPLIPISNQIMVMPLIGSIDPERADQVLETLLAGISSARARVAILDVTGVVMVDTQVANALIRAARAVQLLGAQMILSGIRPEVAQTLVGLGAELKGIITCNNLQTAIAQGLKLSRV